MSVLTKTIAVAALSLALGTAAHAAAEWHLQNGMGYVVSMDGHTMIVDLASPPKKMMAKAKVVPHGTVFFMHDGKLMMVYDRATAGVADR